MMHLSYRPVRQAWCHSTARSGRAKLQLTCASPQFIRAERLSHLHGRRPLAWLRSGMGGHAVRTAAVAHLPWHTIISGRKLKCACAIWIESKPRCLARWQ